VIRCASWAPARRRHGRLQLPSSSSTATLRLDRPAHRRRLFLPDRLSMGRRLSPTSCCPHEPGSSPKTWAVNPRRLCKRHGRTARPDADQGG
jgi:hypothetical protein